MFTTPLGLLGLLALPAIVGLHLYRRRYRPRVVSALFLWEAESADPAAGRSREPLKRNASLVFELLAAACLALALAGPRLLAATEAEHLVAVLDGTASMTARVGERGSALELATEDLEQAMAALSPRSRVTIVRTGPEPTIAAGPLAFPAEAREALQLTKEATPPLSSEHDLDGAVHLAEEFARGGEVLLLTDHLPGEGLLGRGVRVRSFGTRANNAGFTAALRTTAEGPVAGAEVDALRLVVRSFSSEPESRRVVISAAAAPGTDPLVERSIELDPGATTALSFTLPAGAPAVEARLVREIGPDALVADDSATLAPVPRKRLRVASMLDAESTLALGLGAEEGGVESWIELLPDTSAAPDVRSAHLVLGRAPLGEDAAPDAWSLLVGTGAGERSHLVGPFLIDTTHPLLRGVTLEGIVWSTDEADEIGGNALVLAGSLPLVSESIDARERRTWRLAFDPEASNLSRSLDWPILLTNAAETRRAALPGPERTSLGLGESFLWRGCPHESLVWTHPSGETRELARLASGDVLSPRLTTPGLHLFAPRGTSPERALEVGVSLASPSESDLRGASTESTRPATQGLASLRPSGDLSLVDALLLALAALFLALDWWVLKPAEVRP